MGTVNALAVVSPAPGIAPRLYAGGSFTGVQTPASFVASANLAAWDGQAWLAGPGLGGQVTTLAVHPVNGIPTLFAGGAFTLTPVGPMARLTNGQWIGMRPGSQTFIHGLASFDLGQGPRLAISSTFSTPSAYVAQWNAGTLEAIGTGLITVTKAFAVFDDGSGPQLFAGAGAESLRLLSFLAKFGGGDWSLPGGGVNQPVNSLIVFDDGGGPALYVAGDFTFAGGVLPAARIARYRNGSWSTLGSGLNGSVRAMAVFDDGGGPALYVGATSRLPAANLLRGWRDGAAVRGRRWGLVLADRCWRWLCLMMTARDRPGRPSTPRGVSKRPGVCPRCTSPVGAKRPAAAVRPHATWETSLESGAFCARMA